MSSANSIAAAKTMLGSVREGLVTLANDRAPTSSVALQIIQISALSSIANGVIAIAEAIKETKSSR